MYADRMRKRRIDPIGVVGAGVIGSAIVFAMINVAPKFVEAIIDKPIKVFPVTPQPLPPPPPKVEEAKIDPPVELVFTPKPVIENPTPDAPVETTIDEPPVQPQPTMVIGTAIKAEPAAILPPPPPMIAAEVDPRYGDSFQPPYPSDKLRAEQEGRISVRVQIGADGLVKAIEPLGNADASFFSATRKQALSKWRFKPATRGGVAIESWKTMTVSFRIDEI